MTEQSVQYSLVSLMSWTLLCLEMHIIHLIVDTMMQMVQMRFGLTDEQQHDFMTHFISRLPVRFQQDLKLTALHLRLDLYSILKGCIPFYIWEA